ncbi:MAG TPA: FIST N-terminal domain-containing protein [Polyangia bacterium]|nr:FIST N-terminal domain-containing protein [Polyangia bacterium]
MRNVLASSHLTIEPDSEEAAHLVGSELMASLAGETPKAIVVYATVNHDQAAVIQGIADIVGPGVAIVGCSSQGAVSNEQVVEEGFVLGAMALGGDALRTAAALERTFQDGSFEKGQRLGRSLKADLGGDPDLVTVLYDPLCGADVERMLVGLQEEITCPIVGGGAGQPFGRPIRTFQYFGREVLSHSVVALGLKGPFSAEIGVCHGTVPSGVVMTITKTDGPRILTIDGISAIECWARVTGYSTSVLPDQNHMAAWAIAVERRTMVPGPDGPVERTAYMIRGAFGVDFETGGITMQTAIPEGTKIMIHHRSNDAVLKGTSVMGEELGQRLAHRQPWAVLGFECAARTSPFLGIAATIEENHSLRAAVAPKSPWLGMIAWGEIAPCNGQPAFHNYTYPLAVLIENQG